MTEQQEQMEDTQTFPPGALILGLEAYADGEVTPGEHVCSYEHHPDAPCPGFTTDEGETP